MIFPNLGIFLSREPWNRGPRRWTNQRAFFGGNGATRGSARSPPAEEGRRVPPNAGEPFTRARRLARRATSAPASHARCEYFGDDVRGGHPGISRRERARASRGVSSGDTSRPGFARLRMRDSHRSSIPRGRRSRARLRPARAAHRACSPMRRRTTASPLSPCPRTIPSRCVPCPGARVRLVRCSAARFNLSR